MKALVTIAISGLLLAAGTAFADTNPRLKPPRVYTGIHQPSGRPTKASSFAPRSGGSHRHVYGAPIQSPIFKMQPQPKKPSVRTSAPK
jgi:hypothetical protein